MNNRKIKYNIRYEIRRRPNHDAIHIQKYIEIGRG